MWWLLLGPALASGWAPIDRPVRTGASSPTDAAVVIGLERYLLVPDVPHARRDAEAFRDLLVYARGLPPDRVQLLTEGGKESVERAIDRALALVGDGGTLWVYFAGHGAADPDTGARLLLGDDVRPDAGVFASRGVPVDALIDRIVAADAQGVLVLDTCYAGVSRGGESLIPGSRFLVPSYAPTPRGQVSVWTGTSADQLAMPLDPVQHGAFTYFAIGALRGWADGVLDGAPDGQVTLSEAQEYVTQALRAASVHNQRPDLIGHPDRVVASGALEAGPDLAALGAAPSGRIREAPTPAAPSLLSQVSRPKDLHRTLAVPRDRAGELVVSALLSLKWTVVEEGADVIIGRTPMSLTSMGERVTVMLVEGGGQTKVLVDTTSLSPIAMTGAGRNRRVSRQFLQRLDTLAP